MKIILSIQTQHISHIEKKLWVILSMPYVRKRLEAQMAKSTPTHSSGQTLVAAGKTLL